MDYISTVFWCNPNLVDDVNRNFHWSYPHLYLAATSLLATRTRRRWPGIRRTTCGFDDALLEASMNSWFPSQPCLIAAGYTSIPKKDVVITQWILEAPYLDKPKSSLHTCCRGIPSATSSIWRLEWNPSAPKHASLNPRVSTRKEVMKENFTWPNLTTSSTS